MNKEPFLKNFSQPLKLISLLIIIIISVFIINVIGVLLALPFWGNNVITTFTEGMNLNSAENIGFYKFLQIFNHLGMFIIPSILFAFLINRNIGKYLRINRFPKLFTILSGILLIMVCMPFINWLMTMNGMMKLPEAFSGIEEWMRKSEDSAELITNKFLNVSSIGGLLINLFMIAIIPAIGEEFLFRGILQKQFKLWFGNIHIAIFISAFLFSAMHIQFFGFIPRLVLGVILGYLYYFSRNLWVPIITHLFNNGIAVIIYFLNFNKIMSTDIDKLGSEGNDYILILGSLIFSIVLMLSIYKREYLRKRLKTKKED